MASMIKRTIRKWKLICLHTWAYIRKHLEKWISYAIMVMCVMLFILALGSNVAHRVPVLSFFAKEMQLPYRLTVCGNVCIYNKDNEIVIPVKICVGGYSADTKSGELYEIRFSATNREDIPVVICFVYEEEEYVKIEYLDYRERYDLMCEFEYDLGE